MAVVFDQALLPEGWAGAVRISWHADGRIAEVVTGAAPESGDVRHGIGLPGMPNLHSHAFQRGMAGLAERTHPTEDSFWTWRQVMYRFLAQLDPDDVEAIATQLYIEMLETGFTSVAEFHYLHNRPNGGQYDNPAEMAGRIAAAAATAGIGLTLLPVLYAHGGFGGKPLEEQQIRFGSTADNYPALLDASRAFLAHVPHARLGVAPHSLRAVTPKHLDAALALAGDGPIHIHIAEQVKEMEDCLAWSGQRPVEWLLANAPVDSRWCLIHATHMQPRETRFFAETGAVAGLCPQTEANLGDGVFDGVRYLAGGGRFGIGTDSQIRIDVAEDLRTFEYSQRLRDRERNVLTRAASGGGDRSTGRFLYDAACVGGAQALGRNAGQIAPGMLADIVALDPQHPVLLARQGDAILDSWLFAGDRSCVSAVWVAGQQVVSNGRHHARDAARTRFAATMTRLLA